MNLRLRKLILEAVDRQLNEGDPPEVVATYVRLRGMGYSDEQTRTFIARALLTELYEMLKTGKPYHHARYVAALDRLPDEE